MILILNNIYLGDLILKSSTYDDFSSLLVTGKPSSKVWQMSYKFIRHFGMKKL